MMVDLSEEEALSRYVLIAKKILSLVLIMVLQVGLKFVTGLIYQYAYAIKWAGEGIEDTDIIKEKMLDVISAPGYIFTVNGVSAAVLILIFGLRYFIGYRRKRETEKTRQSFCYRSLPACLFLITGAVFLWRSIPEFIQESPVTWARTSANIVWKEPIAASILLCLAIGIVEELIFRGIFLKDFMEVFSKGKAVVIHAIFAGVFQLAVGKGIYAFAVSLVMGYVYVSIHSMWACILTRGLLIALSLFLSVKVVVTTGTGILAAGVILMIAGIIPVCFGVRRSIYEKKENE